MDLKKICSVIMIVSVIVMLLWGFLGKHFDISWIAVVVGARACAILKVLKK